MGCSRCDRGVLVGAVFAMMFFFVIIWNYIKKPGEPAESGAWRFTVPVTIGVLCYTILTNIDVILAAIFFDKSTANYYTAASMLVKVILFLPGAISGVMFPKVSRAYAQKEDTSKILYRSILFTLLLSITVALV